MLTLILTTKKERN
jgi:hypothetical protein